MPVRQDSRRLRYAALALFLGLASQADAAGQVSLSWDSCAPIVSAKSSDGAHPYSAYVSVIGHSEAHKAYQFTAHLSSVPQASGPLPDAWQFHAQGCQASKLILDHLPAAAVAAACPAFSGSAATLTIKDFSYDTTAGRARLVIASAYLQGVASSDPNVRHFLGRIEFDHTSSVVGEGEPGLTCGGFERNLKLSLIPDCIGDPRWCSETRVDWVDLNGDQHAFAIADPTLTFCGSCEPTPATASSWGAIKGQYRH